MSRMNRLISRLMVALVALVAAMRIEHNAILTPLGITVDTLSVNVGASGLAAY